MRRLALAALVLASTFGPSCSSNDTSTTVPSFSVPPRVAGSRTPRTAICDDSDPLRCMLPWPSNTFTIADKSTATGLRVHITEASLTVKEDPSFANHADGFSRISPLAAGFVGAIDGSKAADAIKVFNAQPGAAEYGSSIPLQVDVVQSENRDTGDPESMLVGHPRKPMAAASDHVAVVLDDIKLATGAAIPAPRPVRLALALEAPLTLAEAELVAYHAPTRDLLKKVGINPARVIRVWDFTTRSASDPAKKLMAMREVSIASLKDKDPPKIVIESVVLAPDPAVAAIVLGKFTGIPSFLDADKTISLDEKGIPKKTGVKEAVFRVMIPVGTGNYRTILFGHGTGGDYTDGNFDHDLASIGASKINLRFDGWAQDKNVLETFISMSKMFSGSARSSSRLTQSVTDGALILNALNGMLGDVLSAETLGGKPNPAKGRRPDMTVPVWAGGSLGGSMGYLIANAFPEIRYAVLNVPGAAWTHFIPNSVMFTAVSAILARSYGSNLDVRHHLAMSQNNWDDVDGAAWVGAVPDDKPVYLIQQSIGDPVIPNIGTDIVAIEMGATLVGPELVPILDLAKAPDFVEGKSGITQFRVPAPEPVDAYAVHGFANCKTIGGEAARDQIYKFLVSVWAGKPRIDFPSICRDKTAKKNCDFTGMWGGGCDRL